MATYVLVPGFWLGGWAWSEVSDTLRAAGHRVYPVTLTGLGERVHLGGPQVNLDTHTADVANLLRYEDLREVVLVGHSYAGNVITMVADQVPERIARLVYVDTWPLPDGVSQFDANSPEDQKAQQELVATKGEGWRLPMPSWEDLNWGNELRGLGEAERRHMRERAVDQPFNTTTQPVRLTNPARDALPKTVIWCSMGPAEVQGWMAAHPTFFSELTKPGWQVIEFPTGHWPMFSRPRELAELLGSLG
ncbi:MAG TPA: alpha/beta hydrolase [Chloroflexota bacterium]|nr:alpha/beta hydrolase [Chloroflexota bacterium]